MPRDEEFRRVAEDLRALARSLARDFRAATDEARGAGRSPGEAIRHGLRGLVHEARRSAYYGWDGHHRHHQGPSGWDGPLGPHAGAPSPEGGGPPPGAGGRAGGWGHGTRRDQARPYLFGAAPRRRRSGPPPVRRRWDATTLAGTLTVLFGVAWILGAIHAVHVPAEGVAAIGLLVLGGGLIVTARTDWSLSRHSWPVWLGAVLLAVLVATSSTFGAGGALRHVSFGNMSARAEAGRTIYGGVGDLTVNATGLGAGQVVTVESTAGRTTIDVPGDVAVVVHGHLLAGEICVDGSQRASGIGASVDRARFGPVRPARALTVDFHQLFGQVSVDSPVASGCRG